MSQAESNLTGIRVRGKRGVNKVKKQRRLPRSLSLARTVPGTTKSRQLSPLESLPTEVLQKIFIFSHNVDLPCVSKCLTKTLAGHYLQRELTKAVLDPWLRSSNENMKEHNARELERLLASRFCTWAFFRTWFIGQAASHLAAFADRGMVPIDEQQNVDLVWELCQLPAEHPIRVPSKVLRGPWNDERIEYLRCCRAFVTMSRTTMPPLEVERISSFGGFRDAFRQREVRAVQELVRLGAVPEANYIRFVIEEGGCDRRMIVRLLNYTMRTKDLKPAQAAAWPEFDPMDETLWSWAQQSGPLASGDGPWLIRYLKAFNNGSRAFFNCARADGLMAELHE